jgi:hypothetical protein
MKGKTMLNIRVTLFILCAVATLAWHPATSSAQDEQYDFSINIAGIFQEEAPQGGDTNYKKLSIDKNVFLAIQIAIDAVKRDYAEGFPFSKVSFSSADDFVLVNLGCGLIKSEPQSHGGEFCESQIG